MREQRAQKRAERKAFLNSSVDERVAMRRQRASKSAEEKKKKKKMAAVDNPAASQAKKTVDEKKEVFVAEREKMVLNDIGRRVEGYWAWDSDPSKDIYNGRYPWPTGECLTWAGKDEFVKRLTAMQERADIDVSHRTTKTDIMKIFYRGCSTSRLEQCANGRWVPVSNAEYVDAVNNVVWPAGFLEHYVVRHYVKPSLEFYNYVMSYTL